MEYDTTTDLIYIATKSELIPMHIKGFTWRTKLISKNEDRRIIKGIVYEPNLVDSQDEWANAAVIEDGCHQFNLEHRQMGLMHTQKRDDILFNHCPRCRFRNITLIKFSNKEISLGVINFEEESFR